MKSLWIIVLLMSAVCGAQEKCQYPDPHPDIVKADSSHLYNCSPEGKWVIDEAATQRSRAASPAVKSFPLAADEVNRQTTSFIIRMQPEEMVLFYHDNEKVLRIETGTDSITIYRDGRVEGKNLTEAATTFWKLLAKYAPSPEQQRIKELEAENKELKRLVNKAYPVVGSPLQPSIHRTAPQKESNAPARPADNH